MNWIDLLLLMDEPAAAAGTGNLVLLICVFVLALFVGVEIINKIPPTLHTPLMSGSNAISGITVVGALIAAGSGYSQFSHWMGFAAATLSMINVVGGFLVTHRMLEKFQKKKRD